MNKLSRIILSCAVTAVTVLSVFYSILAGRSLSGTASFACAPAHQFRNPVPEPILTT